MAKFFELNRTHFNDSQIEYLLLLVKMDRRKLQKKRGRLAAKLGGELLLKDIDSKLELNSQLYKLLSGKYLPGTDKMRVV